MIRDTEEPDSRAAPASLSPGALQTPMMRQYFSVKEKYSREMIFFRMGDFYEMFFDDAKVASEILGIALTSRSKEKDAIPMAGVPVRAINSYLPRLLKAGKRIAICEQMEEPKDSKGLVEREVVRIISPGTITDERLVGEKSNNFICAVALARGTSAEQIGLAWLDVTTGQFLLWESSSIAEICAQISRLEPAECLLPEGLEFSLARHAELGRALELIPRTPYPDPLFDRDTAHRSLTEHFGTRTLEGFGCEHLGAAIQAGGGLISYVRATQMASLGHISKVGAFQASQHVPIDRATRIALELTETQRGATGPGTLYSVLDGTVTAAGARMLREWILTPLTSVSAIQERQDAVSELISDGRRRSALVELLRQAHDLERISTRMSYRSANARDLLALLRTLEIVPSIRELLEGCESIFVTQAAHKLESLPELRSEIADAIVEAPPIAIKEGGIIRDGHHAEVDELREISTQGTRWIARFQEEESQRTGIPSLKVGFHQVFGYYIEVSNTHQAKIPPHYIRKQTLKSCERYITPDLKEYEAKVLHAKDRLVALELELFERLRDRAAQHIPLYQTMAEAIARLDIAAAFASQAEAHGYVRPVMNESKRLFIEDGRHPVVEVATGAQGFVSNSIDLDADRHIMIITGPNMAGKSTFIRQTAVLTILAQIGSFIPARKAEIGVVDRIFTRVGASDDLTRGQSTFMVEMNETANILNNATVRSLIILDEVGRGTSTFDGVSLAWAITEHLADKVGARTLFATHYHELTALATTFSVVRNYNFAVKEWNDEIIFLRKIIEGGSDKSYGIHVARLAGIPRDVLERSREILSNLESQALDVHDQPAMAARKRPSRPVKQLDMFHDANEQLMKELKRVDVDRMTPLEALQYLAEAKKRIV